MAIEPIYDKINLNARKRLCGQPIKCQVKTNLSTEQINQVLSVSATPSVVAYQTADGLVSFNGKAVFFVCYQDTDGQIKKIEELAEFDGVIKDECVREDTRVIITPRTIKTEYDRSGIALDLSATISTCVQVACQTEMSVLTGGDGVICNLSEAQIVKSLGIKESAYPIEEEFELGYEVKEVLYHRANAVITEAQCGVESIIVDGKVFLSVIILQNDQKCSIIKENRIIPFRSEIECENAMPTMRAIARVHEKALKTQVEVDQENGKSAVSVSLNLSLVGEALVTNVVSVCKDAFSTTENLQLNKLDGEYSHPIEPSFTSLKVNVRAVTEELPIGARLVAVSGECVEIVSSENVGSGVVVNGVLSGLAFFIDGENQAFARKVEAPFEKRLDLAVSRSAELEIAVKADNGTARIVSATELELEAELCFTVYAEEKVGISCVSEALSLGEKPLNPHAISVYIPMKNEQLWSLAKRLSVCPETLVETNPELTFPLTGEERIVVYRQR